MARRPGERAPWGAIVTTSQTDFLKPHRPIRNAALASVTLAVMACASTPSWPFVLSPPDYVLDESFAADGGIAGPTARAAAAMRDPAPGMPPAQLVGPGAGKALPEENVPGEPSAISLALRCRILYFAEPPSEVGLRTAAAGTALVADLLGAEPFTETPNLTAQVLFADGAGGQEWLSRALATGHVSSIANRSFELPAGASYRLGLTVMETIEDPRDWLDEFADRGPIPRRLGVEIFAGPSGPTLAVEITDVSPEGERALLEAIVENPGLPPGPPAPPHTESLRREAVTLDTAMPEGGPVAIRVPSPFDTGNGSTFAIVIETVPPDEVFVKGPEALARVALEGLAQSARSVPLTSAGREELQREEALAAFVRRGGRAALLLLANEADAPLCADLALSAEAAFLHALGDRAFPEFHAPSAEEANATEEPAPAGGLDPEEIGWRLDSTAWSMIVESALDETISPELEGVLLRHGGALARFPDVIQYRLRSCGGDLGAFERGLVIDHFIALEDSASSVRLRAHDWLLERGLAIEGYGPLDERALRRAALEARRESARAAANGQATTTNQPTAPIEGGAR